MVHGTKLPELLQPVRASVGSSRLCMFVSSSQAQRANNILYQKGNVMQRCRKYGKVLQRHFICQASSIEQLARKTLAEQEGGAPAKKPRIPPLTMPADPQNHVFFSLPGYDKKVVCRRCFM